MSYSCYGHRFLSFLPSSLRFLLTEITFPLRLPIFLSVYLPLRLSACLSACHRILLSLCVCFSLLFPVFFLCASIFLFLGSFCLPSSLPFPFHDHTHTQILLSRPLSLTCTTFILINTPSHPLSFLLCLIRSHYKAGTTSEEWFCIFFGGFFFERRRQDY